MIKATQLLLFIIIFSITSMFGQNIPKLLIETDWSAYDNFAHVNFQDKGKAIIEYAYCSYCSDNRDTVEWSLVGKELLLGKDSLLIQSASKTEIVTSQYSQRFVFKAAKKVKATKLKKEEIQQFLIRDTPLIIRVNSHEFNNGIAKDVQFNEKNKMWLGEPKHRGQWTIKSFYGSLFLIYINRFAVNRDFPLLKLNSFKNGKLIGQPIPSIKIGSPFVLEISEKK